MAGADHLGINTRVALMMEREWSLGEIHTVVREGMEVANCPLK